LRSRPAVFVDGGAPLFRPPSTATSCSEACCGRRAAGAIGRLVLVSARAPPPQDKDPARELVLVNAESQASRANSSGGWPGSQREGLARRRAAAALLLLLPAPCIGRSGIPMLPARSDRHAQCRMCRATTGHPPPRRPVAAPAMPLLRQQPAPSGFRARRRPGRGGCAGP
jgi:hypothetical protein